MKPLTSDDRKDVSIIDGSLFDRSRSKKTGLLANVPGHCSMKYKRGFQEFMASFIQRLPKYMQDAANLLQLFFP